MRLLVAFLRQSEVTFEFVFLVLVQPSDLVAEVVSIFSRMSRQRGPLLVWQQASAYP